MWWLARVAIVTLASVSTSIWDAYLSMSYQLIQCWTALSFSTVTSRSVNYLSREDQALKLFVRPVARHGKCEVRDKKKRSTEAHWNGAVCWVRWGNAGQRQSVDIPAPARIIQDGLPQKRLEGDLCWIVPHGESDDTHNRPKDWTELNWTKAETR